MRSGRQALWESKAKRSVDFRRTAEFPFGIVSKGTVACSHRQIVIPALRSPGAPHFLEPFRWDQRLYPILLQSEQFTAPPHFLGQISSMTSDMCGEVYFVNSARHVIWCVENIVGGARMRVHVGVEPQRPVVFETGVQVNWELLDSEGEEGQVFKTLIHHDKRKQNYATFPIPEPYFCGLGLANIVGVLRAGGILLFSAFFWVD